MPGVLYRWLALTAAFAYVSTTDASTPSVIALVAVGMTIAEFELNILRNRYETKEI